MDDKKDIEDDAIREFIKNSSKNKEFKVLENDGYLYDSQYYGQHDINYTTWTSDIAFNWEFSAGSQLSLVWKNNIDNQNNYITNHWIDNIDNSFNLDKQNSISLKLIYFIDYLNLRK